MMGFRWKFLQAKVARSHHAVIVDSTGIQKPAKSMTERAQRNDQDDQEGGRAAYSPEKGFRLGCSDDAAQVHTVVGGEERKG